MAQQADGTVYIDTLLDTTGFKAGGKDVEAAVRRMSKTVSGIGETAKIALQKQTDAFVKANQAYAQQEQKVESLKNKLKEMSEQKVATDEFKEIGKQIDNDTAKLNRLEKAQEEFLAVGGKESSSAYRRREMEIEELRNSIKYAKGEQEELLNTGGAYKAVDTSGVEQKLFNEEQRLQNMNNSLATSFASLKNKVDSYSGSAINLTNVKEGLGKSFSSLLSTVKKAAKTIGGTLVSAIKRAGAAMLNLHKSTKKSDRSIGSSLKSMLKYGLGIRSVFVLVNRLRSALVDGFKNLVQYDSRTNASISSLMSALTQLKNSFATAFAPILNVVAPILKTFINMVARAVTYVGMLIAALTGQDSFVRATEVQEDYAASLGDTASGYKKAEKAQNKYLSGLDEIRRWENPNDGNSDSGNSGGGYTAPTPGEMFETVPIENSLKNLAEKIKKMWKNADFSELGRTVGSKIKDALDKIPWDTIKPTAEKVGKSIATFLNGGIEVPGFAASIGKSVGELINTGLSLASGFIEKFHFDSLGWFIADGMNNAIDTISWSGIGTTIRNGLNGVFKAAETWSGKFNFKQLGKAVRALINSTLTGINWKSAITAAKNIGKGIADTINEAITPETFGNIGKTIAGALNTVVAGLFSLLDNTNFKQLAQSVAQAINDFVSKTDWNKVGQTIGAGLQAAIDFVSTLIANIKWENVVQALQALWQGICEKVDMGQVGKILMTALGVWLAANAALAIGAAVLKQIGASIVSAIVTAIVGGVSAASFAPVIAAIAAVVAAGILIIKNWDKIKEAAGKLKDWIVKKWSEIKTKTEEVWNNLKTTVKNAWDNIKSWASEKFDSIKKSVSTAWEKIKTTTSGIWGGVKSSLSGIWSALKSNASSAFKGIKNTISTAWNNVKSSTSSIWNGIKQNVINAITAIGKSASDVGGKIKSAFTTAFSGIASTLKTPINSIIGLINGLIRGVVAGINLVFSAFNKLKIDIPNWVPGIGGKRLGFNFGQLTAPQIPYLATGAVIPPNAPFAAVLGDQRRGNNIEAPENLIRKIVREETAKNNNGFSGTIRIPVIFSGRQVFEAVLDEAKMKQLVSGRNPFEMV